MRIVERRDKEVSGGGFGQREKDFPDVVYSLPVFIQDLASKITNSFRFQHVGLVSPQQH